MITTLLEAAAISMSRLKDSIEVGSSSAASAVSMVAFRSLTAESTALELASARLSSSASTSSKIRNTASRGLTSSWGLISSLF